MQRGMSAHHEPSIAGGEPCRAFEPARLPPDPSLVFDAALQERLNAAHLALGRLDGMTLLMPETSVLLYSYVRKEAVMSSRIEGTQSSLSDLLLYEAEGAPGVPLHDVREVSCYVDALDHGLARMRAGLPLCTRLMNEMHARLMAHGRGAGKAPGEIRRTQNWIGGRSPRAASFLPPPPQRLHGALSSDVECGAAVLEAIGLLHVTRGAGNERIHVYAGYLELLDREPEDAVPDALREVLPAAIPDVLRDEARAGAAGSDQRCDRPAHLGGVGRAAEVAGPWA